LTKPVYMWYNGDMMKTKRLRACWKCGKTFECQFPVKLPRKGHKVKCPDCRVIEVWGEGWVITRPHPDPAYNEAVGRELSRLIPRAERRWRWERGQIVVCWVEKLRKYYACAYPNRVGSGGSIVIGIGEIPSPEYVAPIIRHELAHIVTRNVFGFNVRCHGKEWKKVTRSLGGSGKRCECL
jgi:DNA-directed RNA polymerase subunit RPC12/RpoP